MRRSFSAAGSGVGKMAWTLREGRKNKGKILQREKKNQYSFTILTLDIPLYIQYVKAYKFFFNED